MITARRQASAYLRSARCRSFGDCQGPFLEFQWPLVAGCIRLLPRRRACECASRASARTGFFKPIQEVLAGTYRPGADHRSQDAGRAAITLENQIRGLAVVFGVLLPRMLNPALRHCRRITASRT